MSKTEKLRRLAQKLAAMLLAIVNAIFGRLDAATAALDDALGQLRPAGTPSAQAIADEAVELDPEPYERPNAITPPPPALLGVQINTAAGMMAEDRSCAEYVSQDLPPYVAAWLSRLSPAQLQRVAGLSPYAVEAHIDIGRQSQWDPELPPVHVYTAPVARMRPAEQAAVLAQARRNMAASRAEAAAMAQRGPQPRTRRDFDDGAADFAVAGPRFH